MAKTVINARVVDQALILENLPVLASGGVKDIQVVFSFCDLWADATKKTAVFFRDPVNVYHEDLVDDACDARPEAFATPGTVYLGAFAEYADGTTRTCEALPLTVNQGAITLAAAAPNAPNIYAALAQRVSTLEQQVAALGTGTGSGAEVTAVALAVEVQKYTITLSLEGGGTETTVLETDANDYPAKLTVNGKEIPLTVTGV